MRHWRRRGRPGRLCLRRMLGKIVEAAFLKILSGFMTSHGGAFVDQIAIEASHQCAAMISYSRCAENYHPSCRRIDKPSKYCKMKRGRAPPVRRYARADSFQIGIASPAHIRESRPPFGAFTSSVAIAVIRHAPCPLDCSTPDAPRDKRRHQLRLAAIDSA